MNIEIIRGLFHEEKHVHTNENDSSFYYDESADCEAREQMLAMNLIDPDREYGQDPFDTIAALEESLGHPIARN